MNKITSIPIPEKMKHLPLDARGFPVTYTTWVDPDTGKPDFRLPDPRKWAKACNDRLCHMCGNALEYWIFFIGGEVVFIDRLFFEGPMHRECAEYAVKICPFIALSKARRSQRDFQGDAAFLNEMEFRQERPERFGLGRTRNYRMVQIAGLERVLIKAEPFVEIRYFNSAEDIYPGGSIAAPSEVTSE